MDKGIEEEEAELLLADCKRRMDAEATDSEETEANADGSGDAGGEDE